MRMNRIVACLVGVFAVGLATAASASAVFGPAFDAPEFNPAVEIKAHGGNGQGFEGGGLIIVCDPSKSPITFNTNEEIGILGGANEAVNNKENKAKIVVHPIYSGPSAAESCKGSIGGAGAVPVEVRTQGCNYKTTATKPGPLPAGGDVEIVCAATKELEGEVEEKSAIVKGLASTKGVFAGERVFNPAAAIKLKEESCPTVKTCTAYTEVAKVISNTEIELTLPAEGLGTAKAKEKLKFEVQGIENVFVGITGCIVTVKRQDTKNIGFENAPNTGSLTESEETTNANVAKEIKSKATGACSTGIGTEEFTAEYREGHLNPSTEFPEIGAAGVPAKTISRNVTTPAAANRIVTEGEVTEKSAIVKGIQKEIPTTAVGWEASTPGRRKIQQGPPEAVVTIKAVLKEAVPAEVELSTAVAEPGKGSATEKVPVVFQEFKPMGGAVGVNEPHFYESNVGLPAQSGGAGAEGADILSWGTLTLKTLALGELVCQNAFGGDIYNPQGSEWSSISNTKGEAAIGRLKVDAYTAWDCTDTECEATLKTKASVIPEGLGYFVEGTPPTAKIVDKEWEGSLAVNGAGKVIATVGNEEEVSPTQIKFTVLCPETEAGKIESKAHGELKPFIENGTSKGSAPATLEFNGTSETGTLKIGTVPEGLVKGTVKLFGYETGQFISNKAP